MEIKTNHIGNYLIELVITTQSIELVEDITDLNGLVDVDLINQLRQTADELEKHNKSLKQ